MCNTKGDESTWKWAHHWVSSISPEWNYSNFMRMTALTKSLEAFHLTKWACYYFRLVTAARRINNIKMRSLSSTIRLENGRVRSNGHLPRLECWSANRLKWGWTFHSPIETEPIVHGFCRKNVDVFSAICLFSFLRVFDYAHVIPNKMQSQTTAFRNLNIWTICHLECVIWRRNLQKLSHVFMAKSKSNWLSFENVWGECRQRNVGIFVKIGRWNVYSMDGVFFSKAHNFRVRHSFCARSFLLFSAHTLNTVFSKAIISTCVQCMQFSIM